MTTANQIYNRLADIGYPKSFIRTRILPEWWDDEITESPGGVMEMAWLLAKRLGFTVSSLMDESKVPESSFTDQTIKFKQTKSHTRNHTFAHHILGLVNWTAELLNHAFMKPYVPQDLAPKTIREQILEKTSHVSLLTLIQYCAQIGIPVIHLTDFPFRNIDGLSLKIHDRPIIFIAHRKHKFSGWLSFILAHELGHIACGHLESSQIIIDETFTTQEGVRSNELEETEANDFARSLLTGDASLHLSAPYKLSGEKLAFAAQRLSVQLKIDPSVIALNYTWNEGMWGAGIKALKCIEPNADAPKQINQALVSYLDFDNLRDAEVDYLYQVMGCDIEETQTHDCAF